MNSDSWTILTPFLFTLALLVVGYLVGSFTEKRHFQDIRRREERMRQMLVINFRKLPADWQVSNAELVTGSVVISLDYFKRFLAGLRGIIGGRVKSYETLLDRGRREATLRMKELAQQAGCNAIINVRQQTSTLASGRRNGKGVAGVEVLVFGTAIRATRSY